MGTTLLDLHVAACVADVDTQLVNRRDASITGVSAEDGVVRTVTGIICRCANTGYLVCMIAGKPVLMADLAIVNALTFIAELDIEVPAGTEFSVYVHSTSGTALATCTVRSRDGT